MLRCSTTIPKHSKQNSPTYVFESGIVKKRLNILSEIIGKYGAIPYFGSIEEKLVFDVRKKILLNLLS